MSSTKVNLGKVALTPKGEWNTATTYERLDVVSYHGSSYTVLKECKGQVPSEGEYYTLLAAKGADGEKGEKGDYADPVVASFNGRTGPVVPEEGDYTPEMVGSLSKKDIETLIQMKSNENLLDNWYFLDPINQLNKTIYRYGSGETDRISIDRWEAFVSTTIPGTGEVSIEPDGLKLYQTSNQGYLVLRQQIPIDYRMLLGRNLTYSVLFADGIFITDTIYIPDDMSEKIDSWGVLLDENDNVLPEEDKSRDLAALWMDIILYTHADKNKIDFRIGCNKPVSKTVVAAKVEISDHQTLVYKDNDGSIKLIDPPPNKSLELLKCQRYMYVYNNRGTYSMPIADGLGRADKKRIYVLFNLPVMTRVRPAIKVPDVGKLYTYDGDNGIASKLTVMSVTLEWTQHDSNVICAGLNYFDISGDVLTQPSNQNLKYPSPYLLWIQPGGQIIFDANL